LSEVRYKDAGTLVRGLAQDYGTDLVRFIARRVRNEADARDLAQEAYVRLLRMKRQDLIRDPRPYLYRVAANVLYEFELRREADVAGLTRWSQEQQLSASTDHQQVELESLVQRERLEAVLSQLSPKCRAVLILHRRDRMTYDEIAAQIGISASMVKKYLVQGLRHCRERLKELR
jgi:RNA polymerase sigma factor (sigma-70 family)